MVFRSLFVCAALLLGGIHNASANYIETTYKGTLSGTDGAGIFSPVGTVLQEESYVFKYVYTYRDAYLISQNPWNISLRGDSGFFSLQVRDITLVTERKGGSFDQWLTNYSYAEAYFHTFLGGDGYSVFSDQTVRSQNNFIGVPGIGSSVNYQTGPVDEGFGHISIWNQLRGGFDGWSDFSTTPTSVSFREVEGTIPEPSSLSLITLSLAIFAAIGLFTRRRN